MYKKPEKRWERRGGGKEEVFSTFFSPPVRPQISTLINLLLSAAGRHGIASLVCRHQHTAQQPEIKPNAGNGPWQLDRMSKAAMAGGKRLRRVLKKVKFYRTNLFQQIPTEARG